MNCHFDLYLGKQKCSAKGTTKAAQKDLHHDRFTNTLLNNRTVRAENTRIQSNKHVLNTVVTNRVALSAFDDKRYIMDNGIDTIPYGHYSLREQVFYNQIFEDPDWTEEPTVSSVHHSPGYADFVEGALGSSWDIPDPGLNQQSYSESDLENNVVDFDALSNLFSDEDDDYNLNPFIDNEAIESGDGSSIHSPSLFQNIELINFDTYSSSEDETIVPVSKRRKTNIINLSSDTEED